MPRPVFATQTLALAQGLQVVVWLWSAPRSATIKQSTLTPMPQFVVFVADGAGFGIEMVWALDAAHAEDITRAQHPSGRLSVVPAELLDSQDRHKLLAAWLRGEG